MPVVNIEDRERKYSMDGVECRCPICFGTALVLEARKWTLMGRGVEQRAEVGPGSETRGGAGQGCAEASSLTLTLMLPIPSSEGP